MMKSNSFQVMLDQLQSSSQDVDASQRPSSSQRHPSKLVRVHHLPELLMMKSNFFQTMLDQPQSSSRGVDASQPLPSMKPIQKEHVRVHHRDRPHLPGLIMMKSNSFRTMLDQLQSS